MEVARMARLGIYHYRLGYPDRHCPWADCSHAFCRVNAGGPVWAGGGTTHRDSADAGGFNAYVNLNSISHSYCVADPD